MSDGGDYWRDVKQHFQNIRHVKSFRKEKIDKDLDIPLNDIFGLLTKHPDTKVVGDHWRIGEYDFWHTGTCKKFKTNEHISEKELYKLIFNK